MVDSRGLHVFEAWKPSSCAGQCLDDVARMKAHCMALEPGEEDAAYHCMQQRVGIENLTEMALCEIWVFHILRSSVRAAYPRSAL